MGAEPLGGGYRKPPDTVANLVDAPLPPGVITNPAGKWMAVLERPNLMGIEDLARPEVRLAGLRFDPVTGGSHRRYHYTGIALVSMETGVETPVTGLPDNPKIRRINWSPDGRYLAFTHTGIDRRTLWIMDAETARARQILDQPLNAVYGDAFHWLSDSRSLICRVIPENRGDPPPEFRIPSGPVIQETTGVAAPSRTYQDLLEDKHDEALLEFYLHAQLLAVDLMGNTKNLGSPDMYSRCEPSPDGQYILVERIHRPFSYLVPIYLFPSTVQVWDRRGILVREIADVPLAETIPLGRDAELSGPRYFQWRNDTPATLYWAVARDGGDPKKDAEIRDDIMILAAPFKTEPRCLISLPLRYHDVIWGHDHLALVRERWWKDRRLRIRKIDPTLSCQPGEIIMDYTWENRYNHPGDPVRIKNGAGRKILYMDGTRSGIYLEGDGASPEGNQPFLDRFDLNRMKAERIWQSKPPLFQQFSRFLDPDHVMIRSENLTTPVNYYIHNLKDGTLKQLTDFPHPHPELDSVQKELIQYKRDDNVELTATLYLPGNYDPARDDPLPTLVWAYPREFRNAEAAGQVRDSPYRFLRVGWWSPEVWLTMGYAVLDNPSMPIIGEGDREPNDTYIEQLVMSARAATEELIRRGVSEPGRIAVGGHSYGAFMAANLLAHSDLFCAGFARTGAYNRTLTPFGFQAEERSLWEAPDVYARMSPFMHADKINEPILLIHGEADNNPGTFPMQSERFYNAIKGLGGTARLVILPHESHSYRARESILHMLWETHGWLEKYVRTQAEDTVQTERRRSDDY